MPTLRQASLVLHRVIRKVPDAIESFQEPAAKLLTDRHHGVLLTGVALMMEICAVEPAAIEAYRRHVPQLCNIMRSLLMSGFAPEHDVSGITDPFLQVKVSSIQWSWPRNSACRSSGCSVPLGPRDLNISPGITLHAGFQAAVCPCVLLVVLSIPGTS